MPVMITSDSLLYALHKFNDGYLKKVETTVLTHKLTELCSLMTKAMSSLEEVKNPSVIKILTAMELIFNVPIVLLNLTHELDGKFERLSYDYKVMGSKEQLIADVKKEYETEGATKSQPQKVYDRRRDETKMELFGKYYGISAYEMYDFAYTVNHSAVAGAYFKDFAFPDVSVKPHLKYASLTDLETLIRDIIDNKDIEMPIGNVLMKFVGTFFKPRGHYTESFELKKYFMAFMMLSLCNIELDPEHRDPLKKEEFHEYVAVAAIMTKLLANFLPQITEFLDFVAQIIGQPSGYSVVTFLPIINKYVPESANLGLILEWIVENSKILAENIKGELQHKKICIISKGSSIDNLVIDEMTDYKFIDDNNNVPFRKFPTVLDIVYTLFDNTSVLPTIDKQSSYKYEKHLKRTADMCAEYKFGNSLYDQELKMLRALTADQKQMQELKWWPFSEETWKKKLANTQIAHFSELRHDNVLYVEERVGLCCECEYPDLLVEPVPTFWNELLFMINKLETFVGDNGEFKHKLGEFKTAVNNIIEYLRCQMTNTTPSDKLVESLKTIAMMESGGSGPPTYDGWYYRLFLGSGAQARDFKPEVSSIFTAVDDDRGPGGIVHLGTGPTQLIYVLSKDPRTGEMKVFLGPVYSSYEVITPYETRYNDADWMEKHKALKPLDFSLL